MTISTGAVRLSAVALIAAGAALLLPDGGETARRLTEGELGSLRGSSQWLWISSIVSCSQFNATTVNDPYAGRPPGLPAPTKPDPNNPDGRLPDPYVGEDNCAGNNSSRCIVCQIGPDPISAQQFYVGSNGGPGPGQLVKPVSVPCGNLTYGRCIPDFGCSNDSEAGKCTNSTEFYNQLAQQGSP